MDTDPSSPRRGPRVRSAVPDDASAVRRLLAGAGLPLEGVEEVFPHFLVAEAGGRLSGCVGLETYGEDALLRSLAVEPGARGGGIGRELVRAILERAERRGVRRVFLLTTTAATFFERLGFARIGRESAPPSIRQSVEFRGACPESATLMEAPVARERKAAAEPHPC